MFLLTVRLGLQTLAHMNTQQILNPEICSVEQEHITRCIFLDMNKAR